MPPDLEPASTLASLTLRFLGKERAFRLYNDSLLYREYQCVLPGGCVYLTEWKGQLGTGAFAARFANKSGSGPDEQSALSALERALVPLADDLSCLIDADRAAVREPLERRIAGLTTRLEFNRDALTEQTWRIASLEAQLASAREEALREVLRDLQQFADSFLAEARKAELSGRYDQFSEHARSRVLVQTCAQRVRKLLPPPAAQKEPPL